MLVSLHAADATLSDAMTRAPGTHQRTVAGARAALEAGIQLGFNCLVERENVAQLPELAEYIVAEFVTPFPGAVLTVNFSQAGDYYDPRRLDEHYVSLESVRQPLATAARVLLAAGVSVESGGTCGFPACVFHGEEDLLPPPRAERDALHMSARTTDAVACASCARRGDCVGVRKAYLARFGEAGLRPFAELEGAHNPATVSR